MDEIIVERPVGDILFNKKPPPPVADNIAANRAFEAASVSGDASFTQRFEDYRLTSGGIVYDEVLSRVMEINTESQLQNIVDNAEIPVEKKIEAMKYEMDKLSYRQLSPFDQVLFETMMQDGGAFVPLDRVERAYRNTPASVLRALSDNRKERQLQNMRNEVNAVAAANGWDDPVEAVGEVILQDFVPIYNIVSRIGLTSAMAEAAGVELSWGETIFIGSARQKMRESFVNMDPDEFHEAVADMKKELSELQGNPMIAPLLTQYNVLEHWSTVFNEEVLAQGNPEDTLDTWLGNFEIALESLFGVMLLAKAGKTVKGAFRAAPNAVTAAQAAVTVRNGAAYSALINMLQNEATAAKFQLNPSDVAAAKLPKPTTFLDDVDYAPEGVQEVVAESERLRSLLGEGGNAGDQLLDLRDKQRVVKQELDEVAAFDGATVHTPMSTIKLIEDGSGIEINAVFGATPTSGWTEFEDVLLEALHLDPELRKLEIMYVNDAGKLEKLDLTSREFLDMVEVDKVSLSKAGEIMQGEEFFLRYKNERTWNPFDAHFYDDTPHLQSSVIPDVLLTPNAKFSDFFYGAFARGALDEQRTISILNQMAQPYQALGLKDKRLAHQMFEWAEEFGRVQLRNPTYAELASQFPTHSAKVMEGYVAVRNTMDTMYDMLNTRLYREFSGQGYKTVKPLDNSMPTFHGKVAASIDEVKPGEFLDPATGDLVKYSRRDLEDIFASGGTVIYDLPISVATNTPGAKVTRVVAKGNQYRVTALSERPLRYHPGYTMRFYDDPYYVVRKRKNATVDGKKDPVASAEAVRTTGTFAEGQAWVARANRAMTRRYGEGADQFEVIRGSDIDQGESSLYQKQVLQQEGRLFYDDRNAIRLNNTTGNKAEIEDPAIAIERGIHMAARQLSQEDLMRSLKSAWAEQYGRLLERGKIDLNRPGVNLRQIEDELTGLINNAAGAELRRELKDAREYISYMRLMEGTNSAAVSGTRRVLLDFGQKLHQWLGMGDKRNRFFRAWDKQSGEAEPLRLVRSVAFNLFMKLRPLRQFIMQTMQVGFLAGLDPTYVTTGRVFKDMYALQAGRTSLRAEGIIPTSKLAKMMGLSKAQYTKLVKEFERSGLIDSVDVHTYTGKTAVQAKPMAPPTGPVSATVYGTKKLYGGIADGLGQGFKWGEGNNLAGTYMVALRRFMKREKVDDLLKLNREDWDQITTEASNLALAMIKPNNMKYQTGFFSMATQFLSFQHKATLAMLGQNPAMSGADAFKLWAAGSLLYGAEFVGMGTLVGAVMAQSDLTEEGQMVPPGESSTIEDIIKWGLFETTINGIGNMTADEWHDLDLSWLSPGPNPFRIWEMTVQGLLTTPAVNMFGPAATIANRALGAAAFVNETVFPADIPTEDKFILTAKAMAEGIIPSVNDNFAAWNMARMDRMFTTMGEPLALEPTMNSILARSLFGSRTRAETNYWELTSQMWDIKDNRREFISRFRKHYQKLFTMYYTRELSPESMAQQVSIVAHLIQDVPEQYRSEIVEGIFIEKFEDGQPSIIEMVAEDLSNGILNPRIYDAIDEMGLPPEKIALLKEMIRDAYQDRHRRAPELQERLTDELEEGY